MEDSVAEKRLEGIKRELARGSYGLEIKGYHPGSACDKI